MYPVIAMQGLAHSSFMDSSMLPSFVVSNDLKPDTDEDTAHSQVAEVMTQFISSIIEKQHPEISAKWTGLTATYFKPLIDAMTLEGSYNMKPACYGHDLVNEDSPACLHGSPWAEQAQKIMGGAHLDKNSSVTINTDDNFHRVYTVTPVHLPTIKTRCNYFSETECELKTITVTENRYNVLDVLDTGET